MILVDSRGTTMQLFEEGLEVWRKKQRNSAAGQK